MYYKAYNTIFQGLSFDYTIIDNFDKFLRQFSPDQHTLKIISKEYYQHLIFKDFNVYHRPFFSDTFSKYYDQISEDERNEIEKKLVEKFIKAFKDSNWNLENQITDIIKPIWEKISIKEDLKKYYLSIFLRDTLDKFSQKKFANDLVKNNEFSIEFTEDWLMERIRNIYNDYKRNVEESDIRFVALTYISLNKILNVENWIDYINSLFKIVERENT
ncbi:hypothetical protein [Chryseobacterium sp. T20]|uniref:hypothetical protein n=1 Tax=Chryseobacterium sp. T20 TaxID=3395375 RepID=UPI0039BD078E